MSEEATIAPGEELAEVIERFGLNQRQARFCMEYAADPHLARAYTAAGYQVKDDKVATVCASQLLAKSRIQEAVAFLNRGVAQRMGITVERVLEELATLSFSRVTDFAESDGATITMRPTSEVDSAKLGALQEISQGKDGQIRYKLHHKTRALELLSNHLGINVQRGEIAVSGPTGPVVINIETGSEEGEDVEE